MRVIYKTPGSAPRIAEIKNELDTLQAAVGGMLEAITIDDRVCILCNEEGKIRGMPYNITLMGHPLVGPVLIVGIKGEHFDSLTDDEAESLLACVKVRYNLEGKP